MSEAKCWVKKYKSPPQRWARIFHLETGIQSQQEKVKPEKMPCVMTRTAATERKKRVLKARHIEAQYERSEMLGKKLQITTPALGQNL